MVIERGEIWWANLPEPKGSMPGFKHPILILQSNKFNRSGIDTVIRRGHHDKLAIGKYAGKYPHNAASKQFGARFDCQYNPNCYGK